MDTKTRIINLQLADRNLVEPLDLMAYEAFQEHAPTWLPTVHAAKAKILGSLEGQKISRVLVDAAQHPLGWIGAIPQNRDAYGRYTRWWLPQLPRAKGPNFGRWAGFGFCLKFK